MKKMLLMAHSIADHLMGVQSKILNPFKLDDLKRLR